MINDANSIDSGTVLDCEICIVGAGAAGITIALQFLHSNLRVILLEFWFDHVGSGDATIILSRNRR